MKKCFWNNRHLACSKSISRFCFTFIYVSCGITVIWHAQSQLVDFVLLLYMYSSGITVIWHAQSQLVGFVLRLYMYSSGITVIWHAQSQLVDLFYVYICTLVE